MADAHIEQARGNIEAVAKRIASNRDQGLDPAESIATLKTFSSTLAAFEAHRALIVQTIADIRAGRSSGPQLGRVPPARTETGQ
jgi:hypothetical protein